MGRVSLILHLLKDLWEDMLFRSCLDVIGLMHLDAVAESSEGFFTITLQLDFIDWFEVLLMDRLQIELFEFT